MLDRNVDTLLGDDNPDHRLYDITDAGEIVGARVRDLRVIDDPGATASVEDASAFDQVDTTRGVLPTFLRGHVDGVGDDQLVAIALNGRVAAVTPTWPTDGDPHHFEAMLLPDTLRDGANSLSLYVVGGTERRRTLAPVPVESA